MADLGELRALIVGGVFVTVFVILFTLSYQFSPSALATMYNFTTPSGYWSATSFSVGSYNETWNAQMNESAPSVLKSLPYIGNTWVIQDVGTNDGSGFYKFGGHDLDVWYTPMNSSNENIYMRHNYGVTGPFWGILGYTTGHNMEWTNTANTVYDTSLTVEQLEADYNATRLPYKVSCEHFFMYAGFWYNSTIDSSLTEAYNHDRLWISLGIGFDQFGTSSGVWSMISSILLFQPIGANYIPYPFNYILAGLFWIITAYETATWVLKISHFGPFGGGD